MIRRSLEETEEFAAAQDPSDDGARSSETLAANWALVIGGMALVVDDDGRRST